MTAYFKNHIWDMICCLLLSAGLALNVFAGYDSKDPRTESAAAILIVCAVCMVLLFIAGYNRATTIAGILTAVVLIIAALILVRSFHSSHGGKIDRNPMLFWIVIIGVSAVCYLLTRWRISTILLLIGGCVMTAAFAFLKYPVNFKGYIVFFCALAVLFMLRVYESSAVNSYTGSVRFGRYTVQSIALVLVISLAAGGIYAGVIKPLNPKTHELKLITKLESLEILQKAGVSKRTEVPQEQNKTKNENDQQKMTNQKQDQNQTKAPQQKKDENQQGDIQQQTKTEKGQAVNYHQDHTGLYILIAVLIALALAAPFVIRHLLQKRWENKVQKAGPTEGAVMIYQRLLKKLRYAGFDRPPEVTLLKYMRSQRRAMKSFAVGSADMYALTRAYQEIIYGYRKLNEVEFNRFWKVYKAFRGNMKKKLGRFRYAVHYFQI
ncbi:MAG: DUF4129 domain-containing protein [Anaerovoracaceae bacterium]|nr:DUF4129 domain-containing protein [Bacillota bacterium]MDY2670219.1 DUF4129 domain-containing protein [Anaerovoracaceae bacterium]